MANIEELKTERLKKLNLLKQNGINPFKNKGQMTIDNKSFLESFIKEGDGFAFLEKEKNETLVGRIMNMRSFGALTFFKIYDGYDTVQIVAEATHKAKDEVSNEMSSGIECIEYINKYLDVGDFVQVEGVRYITKKGERSLLIHNIEILTKSLLPLPDKWSGIEDEDLRLRLRYMDILTDSNLREMIEKKSVFYKSIRRFFDQREFVHVDTPTLEVTTGGAEAAPFKTYHNDYDIELYMRISIGELWQKRLMAAGMPKTYEIGRAYRNEGSSPNHLQEFTNIEFYWAYADYNMGMDLVRELYRYIAIETFGKTRFTARDHTFDLADEWIEISYVDEILKQTNLDVLASSITNIKEKLKSLNVKSDGETKERLVDSLWKYCRKNISGPAFIIGYPDFMQPLAKRNEINTNIVEQFQVLLGGAEIGKGYSELNDPLDQRARFDHQQAMRANGDDEAMMPDYDYVEMLEHGMPPTCGFGFGERLFAFLMDKPIREVQIFPLMKPKI